VEDWQREPPIPSKKKFSLTVSVGLNFSRFQRRCGEEPPFFSFFTFLRFDFQNKQKLSQNMQILRFYAPKLLRNEKKSLSLQTKTENKS
jgi:hypothetical protein